MNIIQECENACKKGVHEGLKNLYKEQEHKEAIGDAHFWPPLLKGLDVNAAQVLGIDLLFGPRLKGSDLGL